MDLLPKVFIGIGDLPRSLSFTSQWRPLLIERKDARAGDILFVKSRKQERFISHVAMILGADKIFHCAMKPKTAMIESDYAFFSIYEQRKDSFIDTMRYIDRRNEKLRDEHKGAFIADP